MTVHSGRVFQKGGISLRAPDYQRLQHIAKDADVAEAFRHWLSEAQHRDDVYYFSIYQYRQPVGQMVLHDLNLSTGESLVAYHLFQVDLRRQGIGTTALRLLQQFVRETTRLSRLVIITSQDNLASQALARKCGFTYVGPSREDPVNGKVFVWPVLVTVP
jgi:RimJ/RimL family protein N-acetyltransferase